METISTVVDFGLDRLKAAKRDPDKIKRKWSIAYFPAFNESGEYASHLCRAKWYAPYVEGRCESIHMGLSAGVRETLPPAYMAQIEGGDAHIQRMPVNAEYWEAVCDAHVILVWAPLDAEQKARLERILGNKRLVYVPTNDVSEKEYGNYCKLMWRLLSKPGREDLLAESRRRFERIALEARASGAPAAVIGTGPSIDLSFRYDFSDVNVVACNTVIQSDSLMDHLQPKFICAGDVVSHFGVSLYAQKYREELIEVLKTRDCNFFTTAQFGYLLMVHYPEIAEKIFLCNQTSREPVYDLVEDWQLPQLDSTLNIHMLPIAGTIADEIYILGCDGKNPDESKNEDFWAHSSSAQYHDLVDTGHECHPTFKIHRSRSILKGFLDGTTKTLEVGEAHHGKRYFSLAPSYTESIGSRVAGEAIIEKRKRSLQTV